MRGGGCFVENRVSRAHFSHLCWPVPKVVVHTSASAELPVDLRVFAEYFAGIFFMIARLGFVLR